MCDIYQQIFKQRFNILRRSVNVVSMNLTVSMSVTVNIYSNISHLTPSNRVDYYYVVTVREVSMNCILWHQHVHYCLQNYLLLSLTLYQTNPIYIITFYTAAVSDFFFFATGSNPGKYILPKHTIITLEN